MNLLTWLYYTAKHLHVALSRVDHCGQRWSVVSLGALRAPLIANKARDSVRQSPCIATCSRSPSIIIDLYQYCSAWCRATDDICSISEQIRSFSVGQPARRACCCIYGTYLALKPCRKFHYEIFTSSLCDCDVTNCGILCGKWQ